MAAICVSIIVRLDRRRVPQQFSLAPKPREFRKHGRQDKRES
jgi:hypothetical protein